MEQNGTSYCKLKFQKIYSAFHIPTKLMPCETELIFPFIMITVVGVASILNFSSASPLVMKLNGKSDVFIKSVIFLEDSYMFTA